MILKEILDKSTLFFQNKKFDSPRLDAEIIIADGLNLKRIDLYLKFDMKLSEAEVNRLRERVMRRGQGEPVAYITNKKDFFGNTFFVGPEVLVPRPETEILVEKALEWLRQSKSSEEKIQILDIGSGSGCIAFSILKNWPNAFATLIESSKGACDIAAQNGKNLDLGGRFELISADAEGLKIDRTFDLIIANPPYISFDDEKICPNVKKYEPHCALFSEDKGLHAIKNWAKKYSQNLSPQAFMGFEFGINQEEEVQKYFAQLNVFKKIEIVKDYSGIQRHIIGYR